MNKVSLLLLAVLIFSSLSSADHLHWSSSDGIDVIEPSNGSEIVLDENESAKIKIEINSSYFGSESDYGLYIAIFDRSGNQYYLLSEQGMKAEEVESISLETSRAEMEERLNTTGELALRSEIQFDEDGDGESESFDVHETHFTISKPEVESRGLLAGLIDLIQNLLS